MWGKMDEFKILEMTFPEISLLVVQMLSVTSVTLKIFFITTICALPLGILVAKGRMSSIKIISAPVRFYQFIMRGTPLLLQLLFIYFGPKYIARSFGLNLSYDRFLACIIAFVINYAAYYGEIFRGGIASIHKGQYEAGKVLGYSKAQTFRFIILPQVIKRITPAMGSEFMILIKDTALVQIIAIEELFTIAKKMSETHTSVLPYIIAGIFYLILNSFIEQLFIKIEKKLDYYKG